MNLGPVPPLPKPYPLSTTSYDIEGKIPSKEVYKRIMESFRKNDVDCRFIPQEWRFESLAYPGGRAVSFYCQVFKRTANVHVIEFQKTNGCGWSFSCLLDQINEDLEELYGEEDAPMHQGKAAMGRAGMPGVPGLTRSSASIPTYADEPVSIALTDADVAPIVDFIRGPDLESQRMGMEIMVDICNQPSAGALLRKHGAVVAVVAVANSTKDVELRRLAAAAMCNFVRRNKDINTLLQSELECVPLMLKLARECAGGLPLLEVQREACRALGALANRPDTRNVLLQHGGEKCFHDLMSEGGTTCPRLRQLAMDGYQSIKRMPSY